MTLIDALNPKAFKVSKSIKELMCVLGNAQLASSKDFDNTWRLCSNRATGKKCGFEYLFVGGSYSQ
jgi:hypothetical protein